MDIFGMSSLLLPGVFSAMTGADGILCLLLGMAGGALLLWLMGANIKHVNGDYYSYMKDMAGYSGRLYGFLLLVFCHIVRVCAV